MSKFSPEACDAVLSKVDMSQTGIQTASAKLLFWKRSAGEVVRSWERAFQRADMDKRLSLIYLVNDVVQTSRRSGREYTEAFHKALPEAFRHMMKHSDEKVQQKLKKLVLVWRDRNVWGNKALGIYLEMVRGVSLNASPEVQPNHPPPQQSVPDPVTTAAGLFRELQQAQIAVQHATSAESSKATSLKDVPQGGMTLAQQQKMDEQVRALEKLVTCRQKHWQVQETLSKELHRLADTCASQLRSCSQALQRDSDRLKDLHQRLAVMQGGSSGGPDADVGLSLRSLASAGIPPSAPDLMTGSLAVPNALSAEPAAAHPSADAPYTPSAMTSDTAAAATPAVASSARANRRDPRGRASSASLATETPSTPVDRNSVDEAEVAISVPQAEGTDREEVDLAKTLASMAPAESAAVLESIMRDAPADIMQEFGAALVQQAATTQQPQG